MRRADRLFQIVSYLQGRRVAITAQDIAEEFNISVRTVYRDIQDLITTGVPISGEAGVGYLLDKSYYLPPMSLDVNELEALMLGAAMVSSWTDEAMATSAKSLILKIKNVLGTEDREAFSGTALFAPPSRAKLPWTIDFSFLRHAVRQKHKLALDYADEEGKVTLRVVRPLSLVFIGPVWMMLAWCEMRQDFRHFRLDRMRAANATGDIFIDTPETSLKAFLARYHHREGCKD